MFYLIGLGLDLKSISIESLEICRKADKIYIENYTVEFPYKIEELEKVIEKKIFPLTRFLIEDEKFVEEARKKEIVLLVYGSPLTATTHISLILKCEKEKINYRIFHNASILDAVSETGLQIYKFGKIASMPKWEENYKPTSFADIIKFNLAIRAHTLVLIDINLLFPDALKQLEKVIKKFKTGNLIICSKLGTKESRIYHGKIKDLYGAEVFPPFCFIIPSDLHFLEKEVLELKEKCMS